MVSVRDKILDFVKNYIAYGITTIVCLTYLLIDLVAFGVEENPVIAIFKTIINLSLSLSITTLVRLQGIMHGKNDQVYITTMDKYNVVVTENQSEGDRLDNWCEEKNEMRRLAEVKKRLKYAHLVYEKWEAGEYELPKKELKHKFTKRQIAAIEWCNELEVELWSADYLTSDLVKEGKKQKQTNTSISHYMNTSGGRNIFTSLATSIAFAFLTFSLAQDISWANIIFSVVRVMIWLICGVVALLMSFLYITTTYTDSVKGKITALNEFKEWCKTHPRPAPVVKEVVKVEEQIAPIKALVETQ